MFESLFSKGRLSLERMRTLVEVARAGSITKAAPGDATRQSQYSRQLKELEEFFGTELATRHGRRLDLNAEGHRLADIGHEILLRLQDFQSVRLAMPQQVTVGAYESLIHWRLAGRMSLVQKETPKIECRLTARTTNGIIAGLTDLELDFGIVRQSAVKPPLKGQPLFRMEYALFVPRDKVPPARAQDALWILRNVPLALHESAHEFKQALEQGIKAKDLQVQLRCETAVQSSRAVLSGKYCSILPTIAVEEFDGKEYLQLPAPMPKDYERKICLAWNPRLLEMREGFRQLKDRLANCLK
jgi:DNA-binding transcriptional LysR family regulator